MQRVLSVNFPMWSIDLLRRREHRDTGRDTRTRNTAQRTSSRAQQRHFQAEARAILLTKAAHGHETVVQCCERATRMGVHAGLHLAEAQALLVGHPSRSAPFDERRDNEALKSIAAWASRFSPTVAVDSSMSVSANQSYGLLLDIKGCERLFGGEQQVMDTLADTVQRFGIRVRTALADSIGCAWAMSRFGKDERTAVASGDERDALSALPVEALRIDEKTVDTLFEVGVEQIGHLFALSRRELIVRFGEELLLRLDQALGEAIERVTPTPIVPPPRLHREFDGVVKSLAAVERTVHELIIDVVHALEERQCGARELKIEMTRPFFDPVYEGLVLTRPSVDADHLWALLRPKIEKVHLGDGVDRISIQAGRVAPLHHHQVLSCLGDEDAVSGNDRVLAQLLDVLVGECGAERVLRVEPLASHVPEHTFVSNSVVSNSILGRSVLETRRVAATPRIPIRWRVARNVAERPSLLLKRPEPIEVIALLPDGPPSWMRWRRKERRIVHAAGPERIGAPWWNASNGREGGEDLTRCLAFRDYFKIQDELGHWLWVFRGTETGRWFVHGEWT